MSNIIDYVKTNHKTMSESEFNTTDGLVLSELSYMWWEDIEKLPDSYFYQYFDNGKEEYLQLMRNGGKDGIPLWIMIELYKKTEAYNADDKGNEREILDAVLDNPRYKYMVFGNFESNDKELDRSEGTGHKDTLEQYAAMTFKYVEGDKSHYFIAHRGTDNYLEAWNEDFLMAYEIQTSGQRKSLEYVNRVVRMLDDGDVRMGGHSKGGNHSNYSYLYADPEVQEKIVGLYSYDGPGFNPNMKYDQDSYDRMLKLLEGHTIAPYDSVIGLLLFENGFQYVQTDAGMFADHNPFSWQLDPETGEFVKVLERDPYASELNKILDNIIAGLTYEERKAFIDTLWIWIYANFDTKFDDLLDGNKWNEEKILDLLVQIHDLNLQDRFYMENGLLKIVAIVGMTVAGDYMAENREKMWNAIEDVFAKHNIHDFGSLLGYLFSGVPEQQLLDLVAECLTNPDFLEGLLKVLATEVATPLLISFVQAFLFAALILSDVTQDIIAVIVAVTAFVKQIIEWMARCVKAFLEAIETAAEFVYEKLVEFVEAAITFAKNTVTVVMTEIFRAVEDVLSGLDYLGAKLTDSMRSLMDMTAKSLQIVIAISHPIAYGIARVIAGVCQQPVSVDMVRLQNAVDEMKRLAQRTQSIDRRLDSLYRTLTINNIEQGENILTSIADLYNLTCADISVDNGWRINRKADAISETFLEYKETDNWLKDLVGAW